MSKQSDEGSSVMVLALRLCQEYMMEHNDETISVDEECPCVTCNKVRGMYKRIGGNDNLLVLREKYFKENSDGET